MNHVFKISLRIGTLTAGAILLYEVADQFYLYHYLHYQYYITGIAIAALITGILLTRSYFKSKPALNDAINPFNELTAKEKHILSLICEGKTNKEIAADNFIELSTVKTHINNIYTKLAVKNRKEAIKVYQNYSSNAKSTLSPPLEI